MVIIKGQKINDRYEIIRSIGEGGMANVYLAHDIILDRDVAVKILRGDLANDEKFVRRFQREAISASSLNHPNIVGMYDVGEDDGKYFIVMEYIKGQTLKSLIKKRGSLTLPEVIDIMLQLTSGIAHAHESYIIHRDIKPQNVLILEDGTVKITDFGIATALGNNEFTQTNSVMGSVHYLPPEQANGTGTTIKSDIYSLGILMYELLTGKVPFKGDNAVEIAIKQMRDSIPSVVAENSDIPQSIENVILKACAKNPKNRYNSALEMHEDIKTALDPERAMEPKLVYQYPEEDFDDTRKFPSRAERGALKKATEDDEKNNKALVITGIVAGLLLLIVVIVMFILPSFVNNREVEIPNVKNMTQKKATEKLKKLGLKVSVKKGASDKIKKGYVISTDPIKGEKVKKGSKVIIKVSRGKKTFEAEDYVGKNYEAMKTLLEEKGIKVKSQTKEMSSSEDAKEGEILAQYKGNGTDVVLNEGDKLKKGDIITFVIPEFYVEYPDFVNDNWTLEKVQSFCKKYDVEVDVSYEESSTYMPGYVLAQSRDAGSKIVNGTRIRVTVAKKPAATPTPTPTPTPSPSANPSTEEGTN